MSGTLRKDLTTFDYCRRHKFTMKHYCTTLSDFKLFTLMCRSIVHIERIVTCTLQQCLR